MSSFFVLCGEASGDLQGAHLVQALKQRMPQLQLFGVPGPRLRALGVEPLIPMEDFQIMGFVDVLRKVRLLQQQMRQLVALVIQREPIAVLLIDYPGFNLRLAKALRKRGFGGKIIQYISPKVWAWRKNRIYPLAEVLDLMLVIFPFEVSCYASTKLNVQYIGNPLAERVAQSRLLRTEEPSVIGLFPGSRRSEINLNLPRMLETAKILLETAPQLQLSLSIANSTVEADVRRLADLSGFQERIEFVSPSDSYALMRRCRAALATSGTVNLELALHEVPTVVVYRLTWTNAFIARCVFRIHLPYYCMVNIVARRGIFPELIQHHFTANRAANTLQRLIGEGEVRRRCLEGCLEVISLLSIRHASEHGAQLIHQAVVASDQ